MKTDDQILIQSILDYAPIGIIIFDEEFNISYVNDSFFSFNITSVFTKEELLSKSILKEHKIGFTLISQQLKQLAKGESFESELKKISSTNGNELQIIVKGTPVFDGENFKAGVLVVEDIKSINTSGGSDFNRQNLLNILSPIADLVFISDLEGKIILSTDSKNLNLKKPIKNIKEIFGSESEAALQKQLAAIKERKVESAETTIPLSHFYEDILVNVKIIPIGKETSSVLIIIKDVTKELEEKIAFENELNELRRYQAITSSIVDAVIGINIRGQIRFWNESAEKVFGYTRSQVYGKFISIIFQSLNEDYFQILREELIEKKHWEGELKFERGEGKEDYFDVRIGVIGEGQNQSFVILCSSITERTIFEKELRQSEERFRNIVTNTHEYICTLNLDGRIDYVNPHFANSFDYTEEEFTNKHFSELIDPEFLEDNYFEINPKNLTSIQASEIPLVKKSGEIVYVLASFASVQDLNNTPKYYIAVLTDVTEKKQAEKDLLLIKTVFEASQDGIAVTVGGTIILVNNSLVKMLGYQNESEIVGGSFYSLIAENDSERVKNTFTSLEKGETDENRIEFDIIKNDGSLLSVADSIAKYDVDDNLFLVSVLRDITVEKKNREALLESEERYRSITENIKESLWTAEQKDGKIRVVLYTPVIKDITGFTAEQFLNDDKLWMKIIHPDDAETVLTKMERLYSDPGRNSDTFEYRIINDAGNIVWIQNKINIIRDGNGELQKIYGLISDISYNKKAEEELKNSAENFKKLNETKDRFLSIVSHDLRTPFSSIIGFTDYLLSEQDVEPEKQRQYIKLIQESSKSMLSLVNALLDWTRLQTGRIKFEPERIDAQAIIERAINMLSGTALQKKINVKSNLEGKVFVHADKTLLLQVFNNLLSNAIKFTNPGGEITISASPVVAKRAFEFRVKDNGIGIKEEDKHKLFNVDSKFTTPGTSGEKGSGLGLSLVQEIIEKHGGEITVESEYGKGTEFIFTIPVSSMNILLVDDSKTDRILYSKLIKNFLPSYNIIEASDGEEALKIIKTSPPAIVITDHYMPVMSGYDLVRQIKMIDSRFKPPVIVLSSDLTMEISEEYAGQGIEFAFQKPVNLKSFKEALERSLKKAIYS